MDNFSVQWLSKGYYEDAALHSKVHSEIVQFTKKLYSPTSPKRRGSTVHRHVFVFRLTSAELLKLPVLPTADSCGGCTSDDSEGEAARQLRSSGGEDQVQLRADQQGQGPGVYAEEGGQAAHPRNSGGLTLGGSSPNNSNSSLKTMWSHVKELQSTICGS